MHGDPYNADGWVPQPGDLIDDRYRVEEHLDRGGMGIVVRAIDTARDREVALKFLSPKIARNKTHRARFRREVDVMSRVQHPNLLQSYGCGEARGCLYVVTELLEGFTLRALIRREGRLSTHRALKIAREVLQGLQAAHAVNVIHRDVKPNNIFMADDGQVKVLDFGLARSITAADNRLTATGMICGTAAYVAPEILVVEDPGKPADVYAVALVILEMLLGRQVFASSSTAQTFMQHLVIPARIPRRIWEEPLGPVLVRALDKHPDERYPDALAMATALADAAGTADFVLANDELPPRPPDDLSGFLLDHFADGHSRTKETLRRLPKPEPYDPTDPDPDDRATVKLVISDITSAQTKLFGGATERPTVPMERLETEVLDPERAGLAATRPPPSAVATEQDVEMTWRPRPWARVGTLGAVIAAIGVVAYATWPSSEVASPTADGHTELAPAPPAAAVGSTVVEPDDSAREVAAHGVADSDSTLEADAGAPHLVDPEVIAGAYDANEGPSSAEGTAADERDVADEPRRPARPARDGAAERRVEAPPKRARSREEPERSASSAAEKKAADALVEKYLPTFE